MSNISLPLVEGDKRLLLSLTLLHMGVGCKGGWISKGGA